MAVTPDDLSDEQRALLAEIAEGGSRGVEPGELSSGQDIKDLLDTRLVRQRADGQVWATGAARVLLRETEE